MNHNIQNDLTVISVFDKGWRIGLKRLKIYLDFIAYQTYNQISLWWLRKTGLSDFSYRCVNAEDSVMMVLLICKAKNYGGCVLKKYKIVNRTLTLPVAMASQSV